MVIFFCFLGNLSKEFIKLTEADTILKKADHHVEFMITSEFFNKAVSDRREVIVDKNLLLFGELFNEFLTLNSRPVFLIIQIC
jgi:hypothetical protein